MEIKKLKQIENN